MIRKILHFILLWIAIAPAMAQSQFITIDWTLLSPLHTLPEIVEDIPLPDNFRDYTYKVDVEFPEFEDLDRETATLIKESGISLPSFPSVATDISISSHKGFLNVRFIPIVYRNKHFQKINSFKLSVKSTPIAQSRASTQNTSTTEHSVLAKGKVVKIKVADSGIFQISNTELKKMGFNDPSKVCVYGYGGYLLSNTFAEHPYEDLPEVPVFRNGNGLIFHARGTVNWVWNGSFYTRVQNFYSSHAYYFLIENGNTPMTFPTQNSISDSNSQELSTFTDYRLYEKDAFSWSKSGRELYDSYDFVTGNTQNYNFKLAGITNGNSRIIAAFSAKSSSSTNFTVEVNNKSLGTTTVLSTGNDPYVKASEAIANYTWTGDKTENTNIKITHNRASGISGRLNYIIVNYERELRLTGNYLAFRSPQSSNKATTYHISGANSSTVVWDVTNPGQYKQINATLNGDKLSFTIAANETIKEYVAVNTSSTFSGVENMGAIDNQNLHALKAVDMIIIVPERSGFITQANRLAKAHREIDGLTVDVISAPKIYNEFSSGTPDATAYRRLMKMLYDKSTSEVDRPKYLLLFGDCSYDNRMVSNVWNGFKPADYLLSYQVEVTNNEKNSFLTDDYFGFLDDDEGTALNSARLDIGVGRFPVRTIEEAKAVVDKNIAYIENKNTGAWKRTVAFVADDAYGTGSDNSFMQHAIDLADSVIRYAPHMRPERILADAYKRESSSTGHTYPDATKRLLQLFDQGMFMVNYTGHSGTTIWSEEKLLTNDHVVKLSSPRLPIWFTASCDYTRFDDSSQSAGELALLNPKGGAIALISTSRVVYDSPNYEFHKSVIRYMFSRNANGRLRLGDIMRLAKQGSRYLITNDNKLNFNLTGNPALQITIPDYQVVLDEFDGKDVNSGEKLQMKAGSKIKIKGRILTPDGMPANDYTGLIHPMAMDNIETVHTLNNVGEGAVNYTDHIRTLYTGMDSIRNGNFELTLPIPLDINYSDDYGLLNFYACSNDKKEAGGIFNRFIVGGTADNLSPSEEGPSMNLYLNTPDFVWGGKVNETPFFIADLEDPEGINTVGNGIGHDLSLSINGKTSYNLNDYYMPHAGDYTKGKVGFSIPALPEGKHTLIFRAWNNMNKSTTKTLDFEVVKGLRPDLFSLTCTNSPAKESTTFILSHDRPESELDIKISVCDFSGRELWIHTERGVASGNYYYIDWNLCDNAGQRLMPGIYLYRASIISDNSKESTKTEKIVILAQ